MIKCAREPKVNNLDVALVVEHEVFHLQVPVNDISFVQVADSKDELSDVELDFVLNKSIFYPHNLVQAATSDEWHDKVQPQTGLEKVHEAAEEYVISLEQNSLL